MIFVLAEKAPVLFLMLSEQDIHTMRPGRTLFVDQRQLGGRTFDQVILSLHKTDAEALEEIRLSGAPARSKTLKLPEPAADETVCDGCKAIVKTYLLLDGRCITCWADEAKKARIGRN